MDKEKESISDSIRENLLKPYDLPMEKIRELMRRYKDSHKSQEMQDQIFLLRRQGYIK